MGSVWSANTTLPAFGQLHHDLNTDVLIIGGGLAGLLCAWRLHQLGVDYALTEADVVCGGITKDTTAKITAQHGLIYAKLTRTQGKGAAKTYLEANQTALEQYRTLCERIDCDFLPRDAFVYSMIWAFPPLWSSARLSPFPWPGQCAFPVRLSLIP